MGTREAAVEAMDCLLSRFPATTPRVPAVRVARPVGPREWTAPPTGGDSAAGPPAPLAIQVTE